VIFFHHRDTEDTEKLFLFAHRETRPPRLSASDGGQAAMGEKTSTFAETITAYWNLDYIYAPASMLSVCRRLPANEKNTYLSVLCCLCGEIQLPLGLQ